MTGAHLTAADYDRALELWPTRLMALTRNLSPSPLWLPGEDRFWYRHELADGWRFDLVDAATGARTPAFDHAALARALDADPARLPITGWEPLERGRLRVRTAEGVFEVDPLQGAAHALALPPPGELSCQQGRVVFRRGHDLWLREADGRERALTDDGELHFAWGALRDMDLQAVARSRGAAQPALHGVVPSPGGSRILAQRPDERAIAPYPYLESTPADRDPRPRVHWIRIRLPGEPRGGGRQWAIIDVAIGARTTVLPPAERPDLALTAVENGGVWWAADGVSLLALAASPDGRSGGLLHIDAATGRSRVVHVEDTDTFFDFNTLDYNLPNARPLPDGGFLWWSQASGHGHLVRLDLRGGAPTVLTAGEWTVLDVLHADRDAVLFTAGGREAGGDPYHRHLYRVALTGGPNAGLRRLTPEDADHALSGPLNPPIARALGAAGDRTPLSPSGRFVVDTISRVDAPPVTWVRDLAEGGGAFELVRGEVGALYATGWRPPEPFRAIATDGVTVHGVLLKPRGFDPALSYPVMERVYAGPQIVAHPRSFLEGLNGPFTHGMAAMAELGFVIAVLDGPGTPGRSKAFHDAPYETADRFGLAHHRAALEAAAHTRPWMDLTRVGISGHSFGGYAAAMALLREPDFYKVGWSSAGLYDPAAAQALTPERHLGPPLYADGRTQKAHPAEVAANYAALSPGSYAERLQGRLMLAWGDLDENIQPASLLRFAERLIAAGKDVDMLCLPGRGHGFVTEPYVNKRMWDYFVQHLQGRAPLRHHRLDVEAAPRLFL